jgi:AcrR family transcriptional regulator
MTELSLRERKKVSTRRGLADAASRLFAERGYVRTTVDDITAAAGVSPRTFFRYFAAKEDVLFVDFEGAFDAWVDAFRTGPPGEPLLAALVRATHAVNAAYEADPERFELLRRLAAEEPSLGLRLLAFDQAAVARAAGHIAEALGAGPRDLLPQVVAAASMAAVRTATTAWELGGRTGDRGAAIDDAYAALAGLSEALRRPRRAPGAPDEEAAG